MKKLIPILFLSATLSLSSCGSYNAWDRAATGSIIGAAFGTIVGAVVGGSEGADAGNLIGTVAGAAIGAASGAEEDRRRAEHYERLRAVEAQNDYYNNLRPYGTETELVNYTRLDEADFVSGNNMPLEVSRLTFSDSDGDRMLSPGERAQISFEIYNAGHEVARNIAPLVSCNYKRVDLSPAAIIGSIPPGRSVRYKVAVVPRDNARSRTVTFQVAFPDAKGRPMMVKTLPVRIVD